MIEEDNNKIINCLSVQCGSSESLYIPFILVGVSIKEDEYVMDLINKILHCRLEVMCVYDYRHLHRLYGHYMVILNEIISRNLLINSCVDLIFDDEVSYYNNMWEVTWQRFNRMKRTLNKEGINYYYFSVKNEHIVKDSYSQYQIINKETHPYMAFVYFWSLLLRLEKQSLDSFLYGVPKFTVDEVSKLALIPRCCMKERIRTVFTNAYLKNKLKQCPLWMANNYNLKQH
jgi:hypothetical protein